MSTDSRDPAEVARPMGNRVSGNRAEVHTAPGTRTSRMAEMLCRKESPDLPQAQKLPPQLKWTPANTQSHT